MISLPEIARALDGEVAGRQVLAPGPGHSRKDRSLSIRLSDTASLGFVVTSFANDDWRVCKDFVASKLGIASAGSDAEFSRRHENRQADAKQAKAEQQERSRRIGNARALWAGSVALTGTIAEIYLASRRLRVAGASFTAGGKVQGVLRFNAAGAWRDEDNDKLVYVPMLVAAMRNIVTDEITAVHRTALSSDGRKIGRKMLGIAAGAAIKFDSDEVVVNLGHLVVGEGVESALSARQLGYGPTWAMGSVLAVAGLPVLADVKRLSVLEELDESGASARALAQVAARWTAAGREVVAIRPKTGKDMNDALRGVGR